MIEMQPEFCHNLCTEPVSKLQSTACSYSLVSEVQLPSFLGILATASPKQVKLHYVHRSLLWWISMIPFSFRGGSEPVGAGDAVSRIHLAHSESICTWYTQRCWAHIHTHTHTICGVLWLNNLLPKAYLFFSSPASTQTHINKRFFFTHTHTLSPLSSTQQGKWNIQVWRTVCTHIHKHTRTHSPKMRRGASKQRLHFGCENCPQSVGSCI